MPIRKIRWDAWRRTDRQHEHEYVCTRWWLQEHSRSSGIPAHPRTNFSPVLRTVTTPRVCFNNYTPYIVFARKRQNKTKFFDRGTSSAHWRIKKQQFFTMHFILPWHCTWNQLQTTGGKGGCRGRTFGESTDSAAPKTPYTNWDLTTKLNTYRTTVALLYHY